MSTFIELLKKIGAVAAAVCGHQSNTSVRRKATLDTGEGDLDKTEPKREDPHIQYESCLLFSESLKDAAATLESRLIQTKQSARAISCAVTAFRCQGEHAVLHVTDFARQFFAAVISLEVPTNAKIHAVNAAALGLLKVFLDAGLKSLVVPAALDMGIRLPPQVSNRLHQWTAITILELAYERQPVITSAERAKLVEITGLQDKQVLNWFQNTRHRRGNPAHGVKRRRNAPNLLIKAPKSVGTEQPVAASPSPPSEVTLYSHSRTCSPSPTPSFLYGSFSGSQSPMSSESELLDLKERMLSFAPSPTASDESCSSAQISLRIDPSSIFCYSTTAPTTEPKFSSDADFFAPAVTFDFKFGSHWFAPAGKECEGLCVS
jgi:Homeodomain